MRFLIASDASTPVEFGEERSPQFDEFVPWVFQHREDCLAVIGSECDEVASECDGVDQDASCAIRAVPGERRGEFECLLAGDTGASNYRHGREILRDRQWSVEPGDESSDGHRKRESERNAPKRACEQRRVPSLAPRFETGHLLTVFGGIDQAIPDAGRMFLKEQAPEFGERAGRRPVLERTKDGEALVDIKSEDAGAAAVRGFQFLGEPWSSITRASSRTSGPGMGSPAR